MNLSCQYLKSYREDTEEVCTAVDYPISFFFLIFLVSKAEKLACFTSST